jgi:hypothetical protein
VEKWATPIWPPWPADSRASWRGRSFLMIPSSIPSGYRLRVYLLLSISNPSDFLKEFPSPFPI